MSANLPTASLGQLGFGPAKDALIAATVAFVQSSLGHWRDHRGRSQEVNERKLNHQLCAFLTWRARDNLPMVAFNSEVPEGAKHAVDIGAQDLNLIGAGGYDAFRPFLVIECKRLPTPGTGREREYVTGYEARSGGIQRFVLGLHGSSVSTAMLVGYVQNGLLSAWFARINLWIKELEGNSEIGSGRTWSTSDGLQDFQEDGASRTASAHSCHERGAASAQPISIVHSWVVMDNPACGDPGDTEENLATLNVA